MLGLDSDPILLSHGINVFIDNTGFALLSLPTLALISQKRLIAHSLPSIHDICRVARPLAIWWTDQTTNLYVYEADPPSTRSVPTSTARSRLTITGRQPLCSPRRRPCDSDLLLRSPCPVAPFA